MTKEAFNESMCFSLVVHAKLLQSCPTLCDPMDYSPPGSSVHGILQARILEWVAMPSSRGSSQPRDQSQCLLCFLDCRQILYHWTTGKTIAPLGWCNFSNKCYHVWFRASLVAQMVKNPPAMWRPGFDPLVGKIPGGQHDIYSSILAWSIPWTGEPGGL